MAQYNKFKPTKIKNKMHNILHQNNEQEGRFYIIENNQTIAEMTYKWAGTKRIIIEHTIVSESLKGQGVGKLLVAAAVKLAREQHLKISPHCTFASIIFKQTADYADVLF